MEMNTRLQVEHPVTEAITGIDLVEWQIRAAAGERLPRTQSDIELCGHAVEARLYAEDAARDFLPATGTLHHLAFPDGLPGGALLRIDSGVAQGDAIPPWYDPMIAKVIVQAETREVALAGLAQALRGTRIAGTVTNLGFLGRLAEQDDFVAGAVDTGLIGRYQAELSQTHAPELRDIAQAVLAASGMTVPARGDPWETVMGYGHFTPLARRVKLHDGGAAIEATVSAAADGKALVKVGDEAPITLPLVRRVGPSEATILVEGQHEDTFIPTPSLRSDPPHRGEGYGTAVLWPGHVTVFGDGNAFTFAVPDPFAEAEAHQSGDSLRAPMPGLVKIVRAAAGDSVTKGQPLLVLEAMKMEHSIAAPHDGIVADIAAEGAQVSEGTVLVRFAE
jgi:3-methylcrotonyl-CoA carboxylase alpha subunit